MLGNVYQMCGDSYAAYDPKNSMAIDPFVKPADAGQPDNVLRGGAWVDGFFHCRCAFRASTARIHSAPANFVGFRVCRTFVTGSHSGATTNPILSPLVAGSAEFPIEGWNEPITIPAMWQGKSGNFLLAIGLPRSVLSESDFLDLEPVAAYHDSPDGKSKPGSSMWEPPLDLRIGPFSLAESAPIVRRDLTDFRAVLGRPLLGVLGLPALKDVILQIDNDSHKMRYLCHDDQTHPEWGNGYPLDLNNGRGLTARLNIAGRDETFSITTIGDGFVQLPIDAFDHLRASAKGRICCIPASSDKNGVIHGRQMRIRDCEFLGYQFQDLIVEETDQKIGVLGLDFLERYVVTLDFPANRLYLKPGNEFDHHSEIDMAGMGVKQHDDQFVVHVVTPDGPAYHAGVREGDVLTELNGKAIEGYELRDVKQLLRAGDGKEVTIVVRREGLQYIITLKLKRAI